MKLEFPLCNIHAHELEKQFGTDAVKVGRHVPWITSYCSDKLCKRKSHYASFEVIFDVEKGLSFWMDALESKDADDSVLAAIIHKHLHSHNTSDVDLAEADRIAEKHGKGQGRK